MKNISLLIVSGLLITACSLDETKQKKIVEDNSSIIYKSCLERNVSNFRKSAYKFKEFITGDVSCDENKNIILYYARILDKKKSDVNISKIEKNIDVFLEQFKKTYNDFKKEYLN